MNAAIGAGTIAAREAGRRDNEHLERELGFWIYLMSDAIIFALLFATYVIMQANTAGGPGGQSLFSLSRTFSETLLLLTSSFTFGLVSWSAGKDHLRAMLFWLAVTFLLGLAFLGLEVSEFSSLIGRGAGPERSGFLSAFFTLVGTHGLHVAAGMLWILVLSVQLARSGLNAAVSSRLSRLGMFWHFLDIVWIAIFSVVYLPGVIG